MCTAAIHLTITEIILLQAGAIILGVTFYFYLASRRLLLQTIKNADVDLKKSLSKKPATKKQAEKQPTSDRPFTSLFKKHTINLPAQPKQKRWSSTETSQAFNTASIESMKNAILHQQRVLENLITKIDKEETSTIEKEISEEENKNLFQRVEQLEALLADKETEIKKLKQQEDVAQEMSERLEQVYAAFQTLQDKMVHLEKQASLSQTISLELESVKEKYNELKKDAAAQQDALNEVVEENKYLHQQLDETRQQLTEAHARQQKLLEKVTLLQDVNRDLQTVLDNNQKLKNKLRRIGELESILSLMEEEEFYKKHS